MKFLPEPRLIFRFRLGSFRLPAWQVVKACGAEARRRGVAVSPGIGIKVRIRAQRCCVALHSCAYQQENWPRRNNAIGHPPQVRAPFPQVPYSVRVPLAPPRLDRCRLWHRQRRVLHVDAINTFGVSAGRLAYFRVVSRSQIHCFRSSRRFLRLVRFSAAPPTEGPQRCGPAVHRSRLTFNLLPWIASGTGRGIAGGTVLLVGALRERYCHDLWMEAGDGLTCRSAFDAPPPRPPVVRSLRSALQLGAQRRIGGVRPADR